MLNCKKGFFSVIAGTKTEQFYLFTLCVSVCAWYSLSIMCVCACVCMYMCVKPDRGSMCGRVLKRMYVQERKRDCAYWTKCAKCGKCVRFFSKACSVEMQTAVASSDI